MAVPPTSCTTGTRRYLVRGTRLGTRTLRRVPARVVYQLRVPPRGYMTTPPRGGTRRPVATSREITPRVRGTDRRTGRSTRNADVDTGADHAHASVHARTPARNVVALRHVDASRARGRERARGHGFACLTVGAPVPVNAGVRARNGLSDRGVRQGCQTGCLTAAERLRRWRSRRVTSRIVTGPGHGSVWHTRRKLDHRRPVLRTPAQSAGPRPGVGRGPR
jgi:hypothetical protein